MSVVDTPHHRVPGATSTAPGRRDALRSATREAHEGERRGEPVVAVHAFDEDGAAVALGGPFDRAASEHLAGTLRDLTRVTCRELVIDVGAVDPSDERLARTLGRIRMSALVAGTRVEWRRVPDALREELHPGVTESFGVSDA